VATFVGSNLVDDGPIPWVGIPSKLWYSHGAPTLTFVGHALVNKAAHNPLKLIMWVNNAGDPTTPQGHKQTKTMTKQTENRTVATITTADQHRTNFTYLLTGCVISQ
jgi:hypothetical protein